MPSDGHSDRLTDSRCSTDHDNIRCRFQRRKETSIRETWIRDSSGYLCSLCLSIPIQYRYWRHPSDKRGNFLLDLRRPSNGCEIKLFSHSSHSFSFCGDGKDKGKASWTSTWTRQEGLKIAHHHPSLTLQTTSKGIVASRSSAEMISTNTFERTSISFVLVSDVQRNTGEREKMYSNPHEDHLHDQSSERLSSRCYSSSVDRLIIVSGRTTRSSRSNENLLRHDKTVSIKRRETRTKEILFIVKICLVDASSSDVSRHQRHVHHGQWCDHRYFQFDERHDRQRRFASRTGYSCSL